MPSGPPIPDNWYFTVFATAPVAGQIIIPAPDRNVRHIITHVQFRYRDFSGGGLNGTFVTVNDPVLGTLYEDELVVDSPAGNVDSAEIDDDVTLIGSPGSSLTVAFNTTKAASAVQFISVTGFST